MSQGQVVYRHIYVHVPFCGRRCSYCDFSISVRRVVPVARFNDAIMAELATRAIAPGNTSVLSIYLGGGTPSKLGGEGVENLIDRLRSHFHVEKSDAESGAVEITIEVNPEDVTTDAAIHWQAAGVNRVSLGVQSFDPGVLAWMHREHGAEKPGQAVDILRSAGIEDVSVDLIFALPAHLSRSWSDDLDRALALRPTHVSLYGLTVEPKTPLGRWTERGEVVAADEERYESEFLEAHRTLAAAGFDHYEVSNYGLPGHRARHNSSYWEGVPYLGLGPAAHGFDGSVRRWNISAYAAWQDQVERGEDPLEGSELLSVENREAEQVYLGLRTTEGLDIRQNELKTVTSWVDSGWAVLRDARLKLTPLGWLRLDALAASLTALRSPS
ncbi:MAG: radical SAM family heme chaperone HemW [Gemmatimonadaceae bacterium]|nr:radical SAM family heme chaperone HemW [Gemmatimonadaceae bacterium]